MTEDLEVVPKSERSVVVGRLKLTRDRNVIDCSKLGGGPLELPHFNDHMRSDVKFILLVEGSYDFDSLLQSRFYDEFPCIIVHAREGLVWETKSFVNKLKGKFDLHVYGFVDCDSHGLNYLYKYVIESLKLKWLGLRLSEIVGYEISVALPMTAKDIKEVNDFLKTHVVKNRSDWVEELTLMVKTGEEG